MLNEWGLHTNLLAQCERTLESVQNRLKELRKQHALLTENSTKIYNELHKFHFRFESDKRNKNKKGNEAADREVAAEPAEDCGQMDGDARRPPVSRVQRGTSEIDREEPTHFTAFYTPKYPPTLPRKRKIPAVDPGKHPHGMWKVLAHDAKERAQQPIGNNENFIEMLNGSNYSDADPFVIVGKISPPLHPEAQKLLEVQKLFPNPIVGNARATISWNKSSEDALARLVSALGLGAFSSLNDSQQQLSNLKADYPTTAHFALESCRQLPQAEQWEFITQVLENMGGGVDSQLVPNPGGEQFWKTLTHNIAPLSTNEVTLHYMNTMEKRNQIDDFTIEEDRCIVECVTDMFSSAFDHFSGFTNQRALRELRAVRPDFVDEVEVQGGGGVNRHQLTLRTGVNCWMAVAALLGTNRSAFSCLQRFQQNLRRGLFIKNNRTPYSFQSNVVALNSVIRSILNVYFPSTLDTRTSHPPNNKSYHTIESQTVSHVIVETVLESGKSHGFMSLEDVKAYLTCLDAHPLGDLRGTTTVAVVSFICVALYLDAILTKSLTICKEQRHRMHSYLEEASRLLIKYEGGADTGDGGGTHPPIDVTFIQALRKGMWSIRTPALGFIISRMRFNVIEEYKLRTALLADGLTEEEAIKYLTNTKKTIVSSSSGATTTTTSNASYTNLNRLPASTRRYLLRGVRVRSVLRQSPKNDVTLNAIAARLQDIAKL